MKFTIPAGVFLDGLKSVHSRTKGATIDILKHIRFDVVGSRLSLLGHDMSASSEAYLGVDSATDGCCAVPSESIVRLIGSLQKDVHVVVELDDKQITLKAGRSRYKLPVLKADNFPPALTCDDPSIVELDGLAVRQLFDRSRAAIDPREDRAFCMGAYLHSAEGVICAASTDGKHFVRYSSKASLPDLIGVIVAAPALEEISRLGTDGGRLTVSQRTIAFDTPTRRYCSKLIDARFPDYTRFVPAPIENYVEVDRAELTACFQRLASIASQDSQVYLDVDGGEIVLSIAGAGEGVETVRCSSDVPKATVCASVDQFLESMKMLSGEVLQLHIAPGVTSFRIVDPSEPTAILAQSTQVPKMRAAA